MNRDDEDAALAHQQELERQEQEMLGSSEYVKWLTKLYEQVTHEIPSESNR